MLDADERVIVYVRGAFDKYELGLSDGRIRFAHHDDREGSPTHGSTMAVEISPEEHVHVVMPPGAGHGFQGLGEPVSILANCATEPSDPAELDRVDADAGPIPFDWSVSS